MKIAILSRNPQLYSTSRLVEAGKERGHEMLVLDHLKCSISCDIEKPKVLYKGEQITDLQAIIPRIGASVTFYGTAIVRQFEMSGVFATNSSIAITRSRDKLRSVQIFSRHKIGIPRTVFANHPKQVDSLLTEVGSTPVVIKLLEGTQGIGVVLAETNKAATSVIEAFYGLKANILVQEFIKESNGEDIRAFVVNGKVVGAMKRKGVEGDFRSNLHRGGSAAKVRLPRSYKQAAIEAAKAMGLNVCGVDMLESERGPLILEVNSSPGLEGIEAATGLNIAGQVIEYIEEGLTKKKKIDRVGA